MVQKDVREDVYKEYQPKVMGYLRSHLTDYYLAEDLCADVFVKIFKKFDEYDSSKASISTWIFTVTKNTLIDYYRTNHISDELTDVYADENDNMETVYNNETLNELAEALKKLGERERKLIIMRYYNDMTLKDIAVELDISYAYVKILHNKALVEMKNLLGEEFAL